MTAKAKPTRAAKKSELNAEALTLCDALRTAISMDKDANCVTHQDRLIVATPVGTLYVPFTIDIGSAFKAIDLYNALNGCDKPFTFNEDRTKSTLVVSWGKRRATLKTMPKVSIYAPPIDIVANTAIAEGFKDNLHAFVCDLIARSNDVSSSVVAFDAYEIYWTNRVIAARNQHATWMPQVLAFIADLKVVTSLKGEIVGIGGTGHSVTFHFDDGMAVQISLADASTINYPLGAVKGLFADDLLDTTYDITKEFIEGVEYVAKFCEDGYMFVSPEHVGNDEDPALGTAVEQTDIPLSLVFMCETVKLGAFKGADKLIKVSGLKPSIGFYTQKGSSMFAFVNVRRNGGSE